jgi:hypothetical protein
VPTKDDRESPSLEWIHRVREAHYERTKDLPLESWLETPDPKRVTAACERLGLRVRLSETREQKTTVR